MATARQFSERNFVNSIATLFADKLLAEGYLLYWDPIDSLETPDGSYGNYRVQQLTYLAIPAVQTRLAAAKGILTLRFGEVPAVPTYVTRPTTDGQLLNAVVPIPLLAISVGDPLALGAAELGTGKQWYFRRLVVHGFGRDGYERGLLADRIATEWFRPDSIVVLRDHDAGTQAVVDQNVRIVSPRVDRATDVDGAEAITYELFFNAGLEYLA